MRSRELLVFTARIQVLDVVKVIDIKDFTREGALRQLRTIRKGIATSLSTGRRA